MGFSESLAVDALRMFNNSKDEAVSATTFDRNSLANHTVRLATGIIMLSVRPSVYL